MKLHALIMILGMPCAAIAFMAEHNFEYKEPEYKNGQLKQAHKQLTDCFASEELPHSTKMQCMRELGAEIKRLEKAAKASPSISDIQKLPAASKKITPQDKKTISKKVSSIVEDLLPG